MTLLKPEKTGMTIATVLTLAALVSTLGGGGYWFAGELGKKADVAHVAAALAPMQEQIDDNLDARIAGVTKELADVEARIRDCLKDPGCAAGKSIDVDRDRVKTLQKDYDRLKKLRGK